jgi:hypothetical protein
MKMLHQYTTLVAYGICLLLILVTALVAAWRAAG